jgi:hypothetical protein
MTPRELIARHPSIPRSLLDEPALERFAEVFDELLRGAQKPTPCSANQQTAENHVFMKLIAPLELVALGLATPQRAVSDMESLIDRAEHDREALLADLVPADAARRPGGCAG